MDKEAAVLAEFHKKQKSELDAEEHRKNAARSQSDSAAAAAMIIFG